MDRRTRAGWGLATLLAAAFVGLLSSSCMVVDIARYGWTQSRVGVLERGDKARDATVATLDGRETSLRELGGTGPLILIFGSFT